ncbi:fam-a protein [Plasmodium vinckei brucechwatti]|uniref:Fam-a protein n=1 Tax=Plasmodium vinckei brucechwatti TaxID=119398 RepID=A0A6V7SSF8_PLAVN|nr:fam-a protein [Plasmodium vinckei brucechwatti]
MNKVYIKIVLALLSIAGCMQNIAYASEHDANVANNANIVDQKNDTHMLCDDLDETEMAIKHANEASKLLLKLAENMDDYSSNSTENENKPIYSKKIGNIDIGQFHFTIKPASKYSDVKKKLWDFEDIQKSESKFINGNIARVYSKFLVIMEQPNIDPNYVPIRKKYALAAKVKVSNDTTVIICPSRTLNYLNVINEEVNTKEMLKYTRSIEIGIDAEEALTKLGTNISGFVIKKDNNDQVHVTYINSIYDDGHSTDFIHDKKNRDITYTNIVSLKHHI